MKSLSQEEKELLKVMIEWYIENTADMLIDGEITKDEARKKLDLIKSLIKKLGFSKEEFKSSIKYYEEVIPYCLR